MNTPLLAACIGVTVIAIWAYTLGATAHRYSTWQTAGQFTWLIFGTLLVYALIRVWLEAFGVTW